MDLKSSLLSLEHGTLPSSFTGLKSHVPVEWIDKSLANGGVATVRRRKLPPDQVMRLVIGMALYRDRSISAVVNDLNLVVPEADGRPGQAAKSAIRNPPALPNPQVIRQPSRFICRLASVPSRASCNRLRSVRP
jgi:Insertion element 4 transposase N-terminal